MSGSLNINQSERLLKIETPLGPDALALRRLTVTEMIGAPFEIVAEVVSEQEDIRPDRLIGRTVTCSIRYRHQPERHFHGVVRSFARLQHFGRGLAAYRLVAVPMLWNLSRTADCRIFQDQSVQEIARTIFQEHDVAPTRWGAGVPAAPRGYCVQYNEADLDFIARILEEAGCGYFFRHEQNQHVMTICGAIGDHPMIPGEPQVVRHDSDIIGALDRWVSEAALLPGRVRALDHDGLRPNSLMQRDASSPHGPAANGAYDVFRWPGGQAVQPEGDPARLLMEGIETGGEVVSAHGSDPAVFAGGRLRVLPGIDAAAPVTWLVTGCVHHAMDETHLVGGGGATYSNEMRLIPADRPWRPVTPRPRPALPGVHSAIVTGPPGEEIHCDEYGRIKLRFLWDTKGKRDDASSCWVRVAQAAAGAWGGTWMLPRVGDEVLVAFINGDPDRPMVIGSVFNAEQKPIYDLPANKTQSGYRTRSSRGGDRGTFNELRFEDLKGQEHVSLQAEKDLRVLVKHDRTEDVKRHRTETIGGNHTETVQQDRSATVQQGHDTLKVQQGNIAVTAALGKIEIEAMQSLTLKVGPSVIEMTPTGITLSAVMVQVKGQAMVQTKAPIIQEQADATVQIQGGVVLIN